MDIYETIKAFWCCTQIPPVCSECPQQGPGFGIACKQALKDSVSYWLNVANEAVESENESRYGNAATHEKRKQVMVELSDCLEILRDIDSLDLTKNECANLHGSILSAVEDAIALLKVRETPIEKTALDYGLTPDGIEFALQQYQKVICEITHSRMSKLSYYADDILRVANKVWCDYCEIKAERDALLGERTAVWHYHNDAHGQWWECGNCGKVCHKNPHDKKFCSICGFIMKMES